MKMCLGRSLLTHNPASRSRSSCGITNEVCQAARERPVRVYWLKGLGKVHSRISEREDWGRGVANLTPFRPWDEEDGGVLDEDMM